MPEKMVKMRVKSPILLRLILFLAALLRYFALELESVDHLEIGYYFPMLRPVRTFTELLHENLRQSPQHQPLFILLLSVWSRFGNSLLFLRAFPALLGVLSVLATYSLGNSLFGRRAGILAAVLLAVSPLHVEFSRVLNPYILYSVLTLVLAISLLKGVRQGRLIHFFIASLAGISLFYTHFYSIVFTVALYFSAVVHLLRIRKDGKFETGKIQKTVLSLAGIVLGAAAYAPVAIRILAAMKSRYAEQAAVLPSETFAVISVIVKTTIQLTGRFNGIEALPGMPLYLFLIIAGLILGRLYTGNRKLFYILPPLIAAPYIQQWIHSSSTFYSQGFEIRYYTYLVPFYLIAAAGALTGLFPQGKKRAISTVSTILAASVISIPAVISTLTLLSEPQKPDYRYAAAFLREALRDGDALVVLPEAHYTGGFEAYLDIYGAGSEKLDQQPERGIGGEQDHRFSSASWRWRKLVLYKKELERDVEKRYCGIMSVSDPQFLKDLAYALGSKEIRRVWVCSVSERFHDARDLQPREKVTEKTREFLLSKSERHGTIRNRFNGIRLDLYEIKRKG